MNPILLLHGALGSKTQLDMIKATLEQEGRHVFSLNFSGHSGRPFAATGFGIEVFAEDVVSFIKENHLQCVDIFGYSMGGYVALWLAYTYPQYVGSIITLGTKFDWSIESAEREVKKLNPEKIQEKVPAFARVLERRHGPNDWKVLLNKTAEMMLQLGRTPLLTEEILHQIQTPILICLGDRDDMADRSYSEKVAAILPHGRFQLLEDTAHPIEGVRYIPFL